MFKYFGNIQTVRIEDFGQVRDHLMLVGGRRGIPPHGIGSEWYKIWEGSRPGDDKELFTLYQRTGGYSATWGQNTKRNFTYANR
jgi:hypothetical protein